MGPVSAKSYPGSQLIDTTKRPAERAKQELDYGRRGKGYVLGALWEATGECFTQCYPRRTKTNLLDFLCWVDAQLPADLSHVYAVMDNLDMHHSDDLLFFLWQHPRWEMVYQPRYAAYLNLIEPWWKTLRALALKGKKFETWQNVAEAVENATDYWNAHQHSFAWGRRRRHRPPRSRSAFSFQVKTLRI